MKQRTASRIVGPVLSILCCLAGASGGELLVNGGAEDGDLSGWTLDGTAFPAGDAVFGADTTASGGLLAPYGGGFVFRHDLVSTQAVINSGVASVMSQTVAAPDAGIELTLTGAIASSGPPSCDPGRVTLTFHDNTGAAIAGGADTGWVLSNDSWSPFLLTAEVPVAASTVTVRLLGRLDCGVFINAFFDEISLTGGPCNRADLAPPFCQLDLADVLAFAQAFTAADPTADFDDNGVYDLADVLAFVDAFLAGCP